MGKLIFPDYNYVEVVTGKISNRQHVMPISTVREYLKSATDKECYRSVYRHPEAFLEYAKRKNRVAGWDGPCYADYVWIDIDEKDDLAKAHETCKYLLGRLQELYNIDLNTLRLFFSGSKGFHVGIDARIFNITPSIDVPQICKHLVGQICNDLHVDMAVYDRVRVFRLQNTINAKSGLYKIALSLDEIRTLTIDQIKEMAQSKRTIEVDTEVDEGSLAYMTEGFQATRKKVSSAGSGEVGINKKALHGTKICIWRILQGIGEGERDECAVRVANDYQKRGMSAEVALSYMRAWNENNNPPLDDQTIVAKIAYAYGSVQYDFGCNDHILASYCHEDCFLYRTQDEESKEYPIWTLEQLAEHYDIYVKNSENTKVKFRCMPRIEKSMRSLRPGEVGIIIAGPGVGKSLIGQTILHDVGTYQNIKGMMFSLEMPKEQIYERAASMETRWSPDAVEAQWLAGDTKEIKASLEGLKNIYYVDEPGLTLTQIEDGINRLGNVGFVAIDYLDLVNAAGSNSFEQISNVAKRLKNVAKRTSTAMLVLSQVSRVGGDGTTPLKITFGRGSGKIEEGADILIGIWRNEMDASIIIAELLKGRRGGAGTRDELMLDGESVRIVPVDRTHEDEGGTL